MHGWQGLRGDASWASAALPTCVAAHQREAATASRVSCVPALQTSPVLSCRAVEHNVRGSVGERQHCSGLVHVPPSPWVCTRKPSSYLYQLQAVLAQGSWPHPLAAVALLADASSASCAVRAQSPNP